MSGSNTRGLLDADPESIAWLQARVTLRGFKVGDWTSEHAAACGEFLGDAKRRRLVLFFDPVVRLLVAQYALPTDPVDELMYFIRSEEGTAITAENIASQVQYGTIEGNTLDSLLRLMSGVYVPLIMGTEAWPDSVKKELTGQLHKFMATCTEAVYSARGTTELYIPSENITDPVAASKDKDLVQVLESALIHWTRQIKELVSNQDNSVRDENSGPLDEIQFWRSRCADLLGIREQLDREGITQIVAVLDLAKSSYLKPFKKLSELIQRGSTEAQDNLKFLSTLQEPCEELARVDPGKIPAILPELLNRIRLIYSISRYYTSEERVAGLLRKVSNEIINRCCAKINLRDIFDGDVIASMQVLRDSISAGETWKAVYMKVSASLATRSARKFDFDESSIFAQIDAFVQRCRDLLEVCEGQIQFARKSLTGDQAGQKAPLPAFGGSRGPEISKNLLDIETSFEKHLSHLRGLKYSILDVKKTRWHDDYGTFKRELRDLEVMMTNVITSAFHNVASVGQGVDLLESFYHLAKRDAILRCVQKKTTEVFGLFLKDINEVKREFDTHKRAPPLGRDHPPCAGPAWWAKVLWNRVNSQMKLLSSTHYLVRCRDADDVRAHADSMMGALESYIRRGYDEWIQKMDSNLAKGLEAPLIVRNEADGLLEINFDKALLYVFQEVAYWEKLHVEIPYTVMDIAGLKEKLRVIRENVLLVVRDYNRILTALSPEERRLFQERIRILDRKIAPGLSKLTWGVKGVVETFVKEVRKHCREVYRLVIDFKTANAQIAQNCLLIQDTLLVAIEKKRVYEEGEFELCQRDHREIVRGKLQRAHNEIREIMQKTYEEFRHDSYDILVEWMRYTESIDAKVEAALRGTVKRSLMEISRAINGDLKTEIQPIFKVNVILDKQASGQLIEFRPTMVQLKDMVDLVSQEMFTTLTVVPRLSTVLEIDEVDDGEEDGEGSGGGGGGGGQQPGSPEKKLTPAGMIAAKRAAAAAQAAAIAAGLPPPPAAVISVPSSSSAAAAAAGGRRAPGHPAGGAKAGPAGISGSTQKRGRKENAATAAERERIAREEEEAAERERLAREEEEAALFRPKLVTFYEVILQDDDILNVLVTVRKGITTNIEMIQSHVSLWERYKSIWELDKLAFIKRYAKANKPLHFFDADVTKYRDLQNEIQNEETIKDINFIRLDSSPLKASLVAHCNDWQKHFTKLLNQLASAELHSLHSKFKTDSEKLKEVPQNLNHIGELMALVKGLQDEAATTEAKFEPLQAQYRTLEKFEVRVTEEELSLLAALPQAWTNFKQSIEVAQETLDKYKQRFKAELLHSLDDFTKRVTHMREDFLTQIPREPTLDSKNVHAFVADFRAQIAEKKAAEEQMAIGLALFRIEQPVFKDIAATVKDLEIIHGVWTLWDEWNTAWDSWKTGIFRELSVEDMENQAQNYHKRCTKLGRDIKTWPVWISLRAKIDQFRRIMPLIQDLKNPAMRRRHWDQLMEEIGRKFDPSSDDFTLDKMFSFGLDSFAEVVATLSQSASKELSIEEALGAIERQWDSLELDIVPYKDKDHHKLRSTDDLYQALEDNQVTLSTMKASRYFIAFEPQIQFWENTLSHVSETIEMLIQVQRQWMYLESIFGGSEDIRKQLPSECGLFDNVNNVWKHNMDKLVKERNARRGTHIDGLYEALLSMNTKLEQIQKSLDQYLETKRQAFPRFYFLSNDELLEILGQSRDPLAVQAHLKKCFDNIHRLEFNQPGRDGRALVRHEALGMWSSDGEYVKFERPVIAEGPVELWLLMIENQMRETLRALLRAALPQLKSGRPDKAFQICGQHLINGSLITWTSDNTKALEEIASGKAKNAMKLQKKKQLNKLNRLTEMVRGPLSKLDRLKIIALITVEVHSRDVIEKMIKVNCSSAEDFEWLSQLRFYWEKGDDEDCFVRSTNTRFRYGYEYLGNSGRLVITPLTDRCYMTLTTALHLRKGGSPVGPAGTGKTETVKDLGKALGSYVIVINCSDGMDYKSLGLLFSGFAQCGAWGCFDEFNRIEIEVLSVVAQQIMSILSAISDGVPKFMFEGAEIKLNPACGIFVTMNPGYAGRTELPDNLKALFRPISMMVPDSALIAEIMLFSEGFTAAKVLSKKITTLYQLSIQQLSKQDHYDFGLRAIKSVLITAGMLRRADAEGQEDLILLRALRDMNLPKFVSADVPLFMGLMSDLFPGIESPVIDYGPMQVAIEAELKAEKLQLHRGLIAKIIQLYETKQTRHGVMMVGLTASGKSTCWGTLQRALSRLKRDAVEGYNLVRTFVMNPKALSEGELYGEYDLNTREWSDGVLSSIARSVSQDEKPDEKWIVFDGPVDTLWIESMNSLLDDNKVLTLINGERITIPSQVSLLFEVEDLAVASPATVSRCGMVYMNVEDLGWWPYVETWLQGKTDPEEVETLRKLFEKLIVKFLDFKRRECKELVPVDDFSAVASLCRLYDTLATPDNLNKEDADFYSRMIELWFIFCMIWSVGAAVTEDSRKKIDGWVREVEGQFPAKDTVYEYWVDPKKRSWSSWEEKIPMQWRPVKDTPFHKILVPTVDTVRNTYLVTSLVKAGHHTLLVGNTGTGKTSIIANLLGGLERDLYLGLTVNFSSQTTSNRLQEVFESRVEKRTKEIYTPPAGKKLVVFIDDLNMPAKDAFGSQPPLELIRQWLDYGSWYDRKKQTLKQVKDMQLLCAMGPPGGGRSEISRRLKSRFSLINVTFPTEASVKRIYGTLINSKLADFEEEVKPLGDMMTQATMEVYNSVVANMLPIPSKSHYVFNLRDMSKVFQGLLQSNRAYYDTKESMLRLWVHENFRVFCDRLNTEEDRKWFQDLITEKLVAIFNITWGKVARGGFTPIFGDFMREGMEVPVYEEIPDVAALKKFVEERLEDYNLEGMGVHMDLVLFRDALEHVCRIHRILRQPRGNALLVGVGGSGRQSLSKLAAFMAEMKVFQIEISKQYRVQEFHEDLKKLFKGAGFENRPVAFIFTDAQIVQESFLEDVSNMLSSGEVPGLFGNEDLQEIREAVRPAAKAEGLPETNDSLFQFFIERARNNIHVVLCLSPVGDAFRDRCRQFPAIVNCTTIDWFSEWPSEALREVAKKFLDEYEVGSHETKHAIAEVFVAAHASVVDYSHQMWQALRRRNYVTPTNYLELVTGYISLLSEKRKKMTDQIDKFRNGLYKLEETKAQVQVMSVELAEKKEIVTRSQKECAELLMVIVQERRTADEQARIVAGDQERITREETEVKAIAESAQADLDEAMPALIMATKALDALSKKDLAEVKAFTRPPPLVEKVLRAVMVLRKSEPTWAEAKKQLGDPNFLKQLVEYDKDNLSDALLKKIEKYIADPEFTPDKVAAVSIACKSLCMWVRAMDQYGKVFRQVAPKKAAYNDAMSALEGKQALLRDAKAKLEIITNKVATLKTQYDDSVAKKDALQREMEDTETKLSRAEKLVSGLSGERGRWESAADQIEDQKGYLTGDCLVAAAFLSYSGPFNSAYRRDLIQKVWLPCVKNLGIPVSADFDITAFLADPSDVREWNIQGLPADSFSVENGVLVTRGRRWPLMIDPQGQANQWVKNHEKSNNLKLIDLKQADFLRTLENAVQFGAPVLLQDVYEELDPSLAPILNKSIVRQGNRSFLRIGDKEIEYNMDFKLYITTRLANPTYPPEVSTKTTMVNFAVTQEGLEAQLLAFVVTREQAELEERKNVLVLSMAAGKRKMHELEDEILRLLSSTSGSLLDDEQLLIALQESKATAEEIKVSLAVSEKTEAQIDSAREAYRPCAFRASLLFFILDDMSNLDPMYQFSLSSYMDLFSISIEKSTKSDEINDRINYINSFHTYNIYKNTSRGLFEKHKLLFSFQMCVKILQGAKKINLDEYDFFLRGGIVLTTEGQPRNPCEWLDPSAWDNITELDKLPNFRNIVASFEASSQDWKAWHHSSAPEDQPLPGEWEQKLNELQRMIVLRCLRPDRVIIAVTAYISTNLGQKYTEPPAFDLNETFNDSSPFKPMIFVLSPGVDPVNQLRLLAESRNARFRNVALGQGQAPVATRLIEEGLRDGFWVLLQNCHLSISWMPQLEKIVEGLPGRRPHPNFRLWLSSNPHPKFPISILRSSIKMTTEPPRGLKANMLRLYNTLTEERFQRPQQAHKYKKLLFALCWFHSILLERRKFLTLGWNIAYDFNASDFDVSEILLSTYLDYYEDTPFAALQFLIADVNYGGRVTDDWDRRLLRDYMNKLFCEDALGENYRLSSLQTYVIPDDGSLQSYKEYIGTLPAHDRAEAFGQHPNADVSSQIEESRNMLETLLSLQPRAVIKEGGLSDEERVYRNAGDILETVPEEINLADVMALRADDLSAPLTIVLIQETERYNKLLRVVRASLKALQLGIKGLVVMSKELDDTFASVRNGKVPTAWLSAYPSLKALAPWVADLTARVKFFSVWGFGALPKVFWLSAFQFPTGFLTALLQVAARKQSVSIDSLSFDFQIDSRPESEVTQGPKEGCYVRGLYLEGAGFNTELLTLAEPQPMRLITPLPIIHFKPVEGKKKLTGDRRYYNCPVYYYPIRTGSRERPSYVLTIDLKIASGSEVEQWSQRGTAILLSLATAYAGAEEQKNATM